MPGLYQVRIIFCNESAIRPVSEQSEDVRLFCPGTIFDQQFDAICTISKVYQFLVTI